jgi:hypothetical protein
MFISILYNNKTLLAVGDFYTCGVTVLQRSVLMSTIFRVLFSLLAAFFITLSSANAGKPTKDDGVYLGNGFPSGPHFNLIFHGKKADHQCTTEIELVSITPLGDDGIELQPYSVGDKFAVGDCPVDTADFDYTCQYGNVVNMPRGSDNIQILMESGRKGPAKKSGDTSVLNDDILQVTDACTGYTGNDPAVVRIPGNSDGYAVYGRVLGKPLDEGGPNFSLDGRTIPVIGDVSGDDEVWLIGVIRDDGVYLPEECDTSGCTLSRWDPETKGKGAKTATDLTGMFSFSGQVCYQWEDDEACQLAGGCSATDFCCSEVDGYDLGDIEYNGVVYDCSLKGDLDLCPVDTTDITLYCHEYTEPTWIFNIADFVNVLLDVTNDAYNVQLRLYPLPLN